MGGGFSFVLPVRALAWPHKRGVRALISVYKAVHEASLKNNLPGLKRSLYWHIHAESSASIHIVDIADRIEEVLTDTQQEYHFNTLLDEARWTLFLSNMLRLFQIKQFAKFYAIEDTIVPLLKQVL